MTIDFIIFLIFGKLVIFFVQTFPLSRLFFIGRLFESGKVLYDLVSCDLCLGFWVYLVLSIFVKPTFISLPPVIYEILLAMSAAFIMHLLSIGWKDKFGIINIDIE